MIIFLLILFVICFFISWILINNNNLLRIICGSAFGILALLTTVSIILNFHNHYGMHKVNVTNNTVFYSPSSKINMILYQNIGKTKQKVVIYNKKKDSNKKSVTPAIDAKNNIVKNSDKVKLVNKKVKWEYKNSFYKLMFGLAQPSLTVYQYNTFYVPKSWLVLSVKQSQQLPVLLKKQAQNSSPQMQAQVQAQGKQFVNNKIREAMQVNPNISNKQKELIAKKATAEYKQKTQQQLIQRIMPELNKFK